MVAIAMATVVLTAFAYASTGTIRALHTARLNQQAADLATQRLEQIRAMSYGSMGHDPAGIAPDPHIASGSFNGEPIVKVTGGLQPQIATTNLNNFTYTIYTYITKPADALSPDNRRATVVVEWSAYGAQHSKTMSTMVTQTQRGLPLPEFKLTPVGPSTITVNPGAVAAFGFELTNQGAPDQWNITTNLAGYVIYLDNGDDIYTAETDTVLMTDHNGDGIDDTGRLDPKASRVFWVVKDVPAGASNSSTNWTITATATSEGSGSAQASLNSLLIVTSSVITASPTPSPSSSSTPSASPSPSTTTASPGPSSSPCAAPNPGAPTPALVNGYNRKAYVLHNSGSTSWPTFPLPTSGPISGSKALDLMYLDMNGVSIPADRDLPSLSTDLTPSVSGRVLYPGGNSNSSSPSQVLNFRTQNPNLSYAGTMVLQLWVRPEPGKSQVDLSAQVYQIKTTNSTVSTRSAVGKVALNPVTCEGWQEVWFEFGITSFTTGNKTVLGVKVWNSGTDKAIVAYDHGLYPATFTVVEK